MKKTIRYIVSWLRFHNRKVPYWLLKLAVHREFKKLTELSK